MKSVFKTCLFLSALITGQLAFSQDKTNHSVKNNKMKISVNNNKEAIRNLYGNILNNRKFELLDNLISKDYINAQGVKGVEGFQKQIVELIKAFPDAEWTLTELVAEGNKVFVKQKVQGTHKGQYQNITPTNRTVINEGTGIYEFKDGKIIRHQIQTDRLGFLQQLGIIPSDLSRLTQNNDKNVFFVDIFFVPKNAVEEFDKRMEYNRNFIKTIPGFMKDEAMVQKDTTDNLTIMTIAVWQNQEYLDKAKQLVQEEFKKINFKPTEFYQRLNIKMERQQYSAYQD